MKQIILAFHPGERKQVVTQGSLLSYFQYPSAESMGVGRGMGEIKSPWSFSSFFLSLEADEVDIFAKSKRTPGRSKETLTPIV